VLVVVVAAGTHAVPEEGNARRSARQVVDIVQTLHVERVYTQRGHAHRHIHEALGTTLGGYDDLLQSCSRGGAGVRRLRPAQAVRGGAERGKQYSTESQLLSSRSHATLLQLRPPRVGRVFHVPASNRGVYGCTGRE